MFTLEQLYWEQPTLTAWCDLLVYCIELVSYVLKLITYFEVTCFVLSETRPFYEMPHPSEPRSKIQEVFSHNFQRLQPITSQPPQNSDKIPYFVQ